MPNVEVPLGTKVPNGFGSKYQTTGGGAILSGVPYPYRDLAYTPVSSSAQSHVGFSPDGSDWLIGSPLA